MKYTDDQVKENVLGKIRKGHNFDFSNIFIDVKNRIVKISGTVPTYQSRLEVYKRILETPGVISINNQLVVSYSGSGDIPLDSKIKEVGENILSWNADVDVSKVEIMINSGIVSIKGAVENLWQKRRIEELLSHIKGVLAIKNELSIVPTQKINDQLIADDIISDFKSNAWINASDIDVSVSKGHVKLSGKVATYKALTKAFELAMNTHGVLLVNNELSVVDG